MYVDRIFWNPIPVDPTPGERERVAETNVHTARALSCGGKP